MKVTAAFLSDAAFVANGKLYVHGGGWDGIFTPGFPMTQPSMALAYIFRVEYSEAPASIPFLIELLDEEEQPRPEVRYEGTVNVGHPPGSTPGSPIFVPQSLTINLMQLQKPEVLHFKISSNGEELASVPFRVALLRSMPRSAGA